MGWAPPPAGSDACSASRPVCWCCLAESANDSDTARKAQWTVQAPCCYQNNHAAGALGTCDVPPSVMLLAPCVLALSPHLSCSCHPASLSVMQLAPCALALCPRLRMTCDSGLPSPRMTPTLAARSGVPGTLAVIVEAGDHSQWGRAAAWVVACAFVRGP